jgi:hypothetical protein
LRLEEQRSGAEVESPVTGIGKLEESRTLVRSGLRATILLPAPASSTKQEHSSDQTCELPTPVYTSPSSGSIETPPQPHIPPRLSGPGTGSQVAIASGASRGIANRLPSGNPFEAPASQ